MDPGTLPLGHPQFYPTSDHPIGYRGDGNSYFPGAKVPAVWWEGTPVWQNTAKPQRINNAEFADQVPFNLVWKTAMPAWASAQPLVVGDKVFTLCNPDTLTCVDARTGKILWSQQCNAWEIAGVDAATATTCREMMDVWLTIRAVHALSQRRSLTVAAFRSMGTVFLAQGFPRIIAALKRLDPATDYAPNLVLFEKQVKACLDNPANNALLTSTGDPSLLGQLDKRIQQLSGRDIRVKGYWGNLFGYCLSAPVSDGTHIYASFWQGQVVCYRLDGTRVWARWSAPRPSILSPLLCHGVLCDPQDNDTIVGREAATGKELWRTTLNTRTRREDPVACDKVLTLSNGKETVDVLVTSRGPILRISDGKMLGALPYRRANWEGCSLVGSGDVIFKGACGYPDNGPQEAYRLILDNRETVSVVKLWSHRPGEGGGYTPPALIGDVLVRNSRAGGVMTLDTGEALAPEGSAVGGLSQLIAGNLVIWQDGHTETFRRPDNKAMQRYLVSQMTQPWAPVSMSRLNWLGDNVFPLFPEYQKYIPELTTNPDFYGVSAGQFGYFVWADNPFAIQGNRLFLRTFSHLYCFGDPTESYCYSPDVTGDAAVDAPSAAQLPALLTRLTDPQRPLRLAAAAALRRLGKAAAPATPRLLELLASPRDADVEMAILGFRALGPAAESAVIPLVQMAVNGKETERMHAVLALSRIGAPVATACARLVGDPKTRPTALAVLAYAEGIDDDKARLLAGIYATYDQTNCPKELLITDHDAQAWEISRELLLRMGATARAALPTLKVMAADHTDVYASLQVAQVLTAIDPESATDRLPDAVKALSGPEGNPGPGTAAALAVLCALGGHAVTALPRLQALADNPNWPSRQQSQLRGVTSRIALAAKRTWVTTFTADQQYIEPGDDVTLNWHATNATQVTITPQVGKVAASGTLVLRPAETTRYRLSATGPTGTETRELTVKVHGGARQAIQVDAFQPGLAAEYFRTRTDGSLPNYDELTPNGRSVVSAFPRQDFAGSGLYTNFGAYFTGTLLIPRDGAYTFTLQCVGTANLLIDAKSVVSASRGAFFPPPHNGKPTLARGTMTLTTGPHQFTVLYTANKYATALYVSWEGPGIANTVIPATAFPTGLSVEYSQFSDNSIKRAWDNMMSGKWPYPPVPGVAGVPPKMKPWQPTARGTVPALQYSDIWPAFHGRRYQFAARFQGLLQVPTNGTYTLYTTSAYGTALLLSDEMIIQDDGKHDMRDASCTVDLTAGLHPITILYADQGFHDFWHGPGLIVSWQGPNIPKAEIPASAFKHEAPPLREPVATGPVQPGLRADYFLLNTCDGRLPDFAALKSYLSVVIPAPAFDLAGIKRRNNHAERFTGILNVPRDGEYTLYLNSIDGSTATIDGEIVVENDGRHNLHEAVGKLVPLKAGKHRLSILHCLGGGRTGVTLSWEGPGFEKSLVPASALWHEE